MTLDSEAILGHQPQPAPEPVETKTDLLRRLKAMPSLSRVAYGVAGGGVAATLTTRLRPVSISGLDNDDDDDDQVAANVDMFAPPPSVSTAAPFAAVAGSDGAFGGTRTSGLICR